MGIFTKTIGEGYDREEVVVWSRVFSAISGVILLLTLLLSFYTITSGYVGVLSTLGKYDKNEVQPGLHFKIPYAQSVTEFNVKVHTVNYKGKRDLDDTEDIINKPHIVVLDKNNQPITLELTVQYQPVASQASEILETYGSNYFYKAINPIIREVVRDVIGQYEAETIALNRTVIAAKLKEDLINRYKNNHQFVVREVSLRNIALPQIVVKKIQEVQLAKQEEQRLIRVKAQAQKHQEIKTIEAKTKLIEVETAAKANATKAKIEADARAYKVLKEAEAEAKANDLVNKSLTQQLVEYKKVQQWTGELPKTILGNSVPMINIK